MRWESEKMKHEFEGAYRKRGGGASLRYLGIMALPAVALCLVCGCTPQSSSDGTDSADSSSSTAVTAEWSTDSDCGVCHTNEQDSMTDTACLASKHSSVACVDCHSDVEALSTAHADMTTATRMPTKLKTTSVTSDVCESCHDTETIKSVGDVIVDSAGNAANPHDLPVNEKHATIECTDCHVMHSSEDGDTLTVANETCTSCHHKGIYQACITCHS